MGGAVRSQGEQEVTAIRGGSCIWLQREEKIAVVLLLMALSSLAVAYWSFGISGSDDDISLSGRIVDIRETRTGGHLIITLDSTQMQIFLPAKVAKEVRGSLSPGDHLQVRGRLAEYMGRSEIEVSRPSDITRL